MTTKEKAQEMVGKFYEVEGIMEREYAKQCAVIAVDEIITFLDELDSNYAGWWGVVKKEIEAL